MSYTCRWRRPVVVCLMLMVVVKSGYTQTAVVPTNPKIITLHDAILAATQTTSIAQMNPKIATAMAMVRLSRAHVRETQSSLNPNADALLLAGRRDRFGASIPLSGSNRADLPLVALGTPYGSDAGAGVLIDMDLDISGIARRQVKMSRLDLDLSEQRLNQDIHEISADVATAYFDALRARELVDIWKASNLRLERLKVVLHDYVLTDAGALMLSRIEADLLDAAQELSGAEATSEITMKQLARPIGMSGKEFEISNPNLPEPTLPELEKAVLLAENSRTESHAARTLYDRTRLALLLANRSTQPSLTIGAAAATITKPYDGTNETLTWTAFLNLRLPLYDGGVYRARKAEALASQDAAQQNIVIIRDHIRLDVEKAYYALVSAIKRKKLSGQATSQATDQYDKALHRLEEGAIRAGVAPLIETGDAQRALLFAELNSVNARYDVLISFIYLQRAEGISFEP